MSPRQADGPAGLRPGAFAAVGCGLIERVDNTVVVEALGGKGTEATTLEQLPRSPLRDMGMTHRAIAEILCVLAVR